MAVDAKLRSACEVLPPTDARGSLSGSAQLSLGAAVAEVSGSLITPTGIPIAPANTRARAHAHLLPLTTPPPRPARVTSLLQAAVGISQRGEFSAMGGLKLLRWADGLAELGSEQFRRPFISSINGKDQVAWELINWQTVAVISASALGARGSSWEVGEPSGAHLGPLLVCNPCHCNLDPPRGLT